MRTLTICPAPLVNQWQIIEGQGANAKRLGGVEYNPDTWYSYEPLPGLTRRQARDAAIKRAELLCAAEGGTLWVSSWNRLIWEKIIFVKPFKRA